MRGIRSSRTVNRAGGRDFVGHTATVLCAVAVLAVGCGSAGGTPTPASTAASSSASDNGSAGPAPSTAVSRTANSSSAAVSITEPTRTTPSAETSAETSTETSTTDSGLSGNPSPPGAVDTTSATAPKALSLMNGALLKPADLGAGFATRKYTAPDPMDTSTKLPCGQPTANVQYPNALRTGTILTKGNSAQLEESVALYPSDGVAEKAFAVNEAGVSCRKGTQGGITFTISAGQDVTAELGGDRAEAWSITVGADKGVLALVRSGSLTVGFTFLMAAGTDATALPNALAVAKTATARLIATGL